MKGVNNNLRLHSAGSVGILTLTGRYLGEEAESAASRRIGLILQILASGGELVSCKKQLTLDNLSRSRSAALKLDER